MAPEAAGWDWVGINLEGGGALMAFRMRDRAGRALWAGGTLRSADGRVRTFAPDEIRFTAVRSWRSPRTGITYPVGMALDAGELAYSLEPLMDDQELDSRASTGTIYWEGAVRATASGREVGTRLPRADGLRRAAADVRTICGVSRMPGVARRDSPAGAWGMKPEGESRRATPRHHHTDMLDSAPSSA